jgi:phosphate uptake regulator
MSDFFSKLKKGIDKGTAIVSAKSSTLIETNKLKSEITTTQRVKKETLIELGTKVYTLQKEGGFDIGAVLDLINSISEADIKVAELEAQILVIQDEEKAKLDVINAPESVGEKVDDAIDVVSEEVEEVVEEVTEEVEDVIEDVEEIIEDETRNN